MLFTEKDYFGCICLLKFLERNAGVKTFNLPRLQQGYMRKAYD